MSKFTQITKAIWVTSVSVRPTRVRDVYAAQQRISVETSVHEYGSCAQTHSSYMYLGSLKTSDDVLVADKQ